MTTRIAASPTRQPAQATVQPTRRKQPATHRPIDRLGGVVLDFAAHPVRSSIDVARARAESGEPLPHSIRSSIGRSVDWNIHQPTDPGPTHRFGDWSISDDKSPAERSARRLGQTSEPRRTDPRNDRADRFGDVRVHTGPAARRASATLDASAFSVDNHIFFGQGRFEPSTRAGRELIAHELAHVAQAQQRGAGTRLIMRESLAERAGAWYDAKKWQVYRAMIAGLKRAKSATIGAGRAIVTRLPAWLQPLASAVLDVGDVVLDMMIALLLLIVGLAVGFVEGIVGLVTGLVKLAYMALKMLADMLASMAGRPEAFRKDITAMLNGIAAIPAGMKQLFDAWIERYKKATLEEQVLMGGELIGQVEAFLATLAFAGTKAGQAGAAAEGAVVVRGGSGGLLALEHAPAVVTPATLEATAQVGVVTAQAMTMSGPGGRGGSGDGPGVKQPVDPIDEATSRVETEPNVERSTVNTKKESMAPGEWSRQRAGATKRLYNLFERRAALRLKKIFPGRQILEQAEVVGVRAKGASTVKPTSAISKSGRGRIADIVEVDGTNATLTDLKSPSTQVRSVKGGMSSADVEAEFRSTSEIAQQHVVEREVIDEAARTGGEVIIKGRDPVTGDVVEVALQPASIRSRVTDYTDIGNN